MLRPTWLFLAVLICALGEVGAHAFFRHRAPALTEWRELTPTVRALVHPTDCIEVAPKWAEPLARTAFGDALMPLEKVSRPDNDACERIIQVSILGQTDPTSATWRETASQVQGRFRISTRANPNWLPLRYSFLEQVDEGALSVTVGTGASAVACPFSDHAGQSAGGLGGDPTAPRRRYQCSDGKYHWVGVTIIDDEHYYARRCIWAPPSQLGPVTLRFEHVTLGRKLVGHAGGPWLMVRDGIGPPITLAASVNQTRVGQAHLRDIDGWVRFEWDTSQFDSMSSEVTLQITGTPRVEQRFCFTLDAR